MNKKNILFLEPSGAQTNFFSSSTPLPLLGPMYMATKLKNLGYNVKVIKENFISKKIFNDLLQEADILILTLLTTSAMRGYEIAQQYKKMKPHGTVIAGGIHVSFMPHEALQYVDQVVIGEGLLIIQDIIERKIKKALVKAPHFEDLDQQPIPDYSLFVNSNKLDRIPLMTSLGCPFGCTFCCVTKMYGRRYRHQSPDRTIIEIKHHFQQLGKKRVFFYDDNFCANKKISLELFNKIIENNLNFLWSCQVRADLAKDESFVKKMAEAGCYRVYIGFESINQNTLDTLKKSESIQEIENAIKMFHKYGITVHGMFIFGSDEDDLDTFHKTAEFCISHGIEHAQFLLITLFPGTDLYNSLDESRFIHKNWDIMDGFHVNMAHKNMTQYQIIQGLVYAYDKIYSWKKIVLQIGKDFLFLFNNTRTFKYSILKLIQNFQKNIGFIIMIKKWKHNHREYHNYLKMMHDHELNTKKYTY